MIEDLTSPDVVESASGVCPSPSVLQVVAGGSNVVHGALDDLLSIDVIEGRVDRTNKAGNPADDRTRQRRAARPSIGASFLDRPDIQSRREKVNTWTQ